MNAKLISLGAVLALVSTTVCAHQPGGRSSVYVDPNAPGTSAKVDTTQPAAGGGRGSVYARDLPAPTPRDRVHAVVLKPGRA